VSFEGKVLLFCLVSDNGSGDLYFPVGRRRLAETIEGRLLANLEGLLAGYFAEPISKNLLGVISPTRGSHSTG
jgi:hypothetical protein